MSTNHLIFLFKLQNLSPPRTLSEPKGGPAVSGSTFPRGDACTATGGSAVRVGDRPGRWATPQSPLLPPRLAAGLCVTPGPDTGRAPPPSLHGVSRQISSWGGARSPGGTRDSPEHGAVSGRAAPQGPPWDRALSPSRHWRWRGLLAGQVQPKACPESSGGPPTARGSATCPRPSPHHCSGRHGQQAGLGVRCSSELRVSASWELPRGNKRRPESRVPVPWRSSARVAHVRSGRPGSVSTTASL